MRKLMLIPALAAALSLPAPSQCVMCYLSAKSQNSARARVMDWGILVLGVPPALILAGFVVFVRSRNNRYRGD
jgi:hypothetical protein